MASTRDDTVRLLAAVRSGDRSAEGELYTVVYKELHELAHAALRGEPAGHVLQTTALLHEAYLRLLPATGLSFADRRHFLCVAASTMRRVLVDEARRRRSAKRGGGHAPLSLEAAEAQVGRAAKERSLFEDLEALDHALSKLEKSAEFERMCRVVDLLFFAGTTQDEAAEILGVSKGTVRRDWEFAKVWLRREITREEDDGP